MPLAGLLGIIAVSVASVGRILAIILNELLDFPLQLDLGV